MSRQHVFLSHSTHDDRVVDAIHRVLDEHHVRGWIDSRVLKPGDPLDPNIEQAIRDADSFVVVLSQQAMESDWVVKECQLAKQVRDQRPGKFRIVPVLIDGIRPNAVKPWLGDDVVAIELESLDPHELTDATAELLTALGVDLAHDEPEDDLDQAALSDLVLELTQPTMVLQDGKRRPTAQARLVLQPAVGEPVAGQPFAFTAPLGPIETEELRWYLESFYRWTSDVLRERAKRVEQQLPAWGKRLFAAALSDPAAAPVLAEWRKPRPGDKSLRRFTVFVDPAGEGSGTSKFKIAFAILNFEVPDPVPPADAQEAATQLLALPWELLHDPKFADGHGYLFRGARPVRVRRRLPDAAVVEPTPVDPPIRVLLVSPRPEDDAAGYIDHRVSARPLVDALAKLGGLAELTLLDPPTLSALDAELRRAFDAGRPYHVVHFDGHGVYDRRHGLGSLCFERSHLAPRDEPAACDAGSPAAHHAERDGYVSHLVSADELAGVLRDHHIPLFVLEACQSAKAETDPTASVAGRLLACGVSSVVAMSHSVLVETARRFTAVFYDRLVRGARVGQALLAAQDALFQKTFRLDTFAGPLHMQDWFVPVLFQERPDPQLLAKLPTGSMKAMFARARELNLGGLPAPPPHTFVGRSRELLAAERLLCGTRHLPDLGDRDPPRDAPYVVLIGEGGEGKTTLAAELARWLVESQRFDRAAFVSVEHEASAHSVLHQLGQQLVAGWVEETQMNDEEGLRLLRRTLNEWDCVLVIDNLESLLPVPSTQYQVPSSDLLTSLFALLTSLLTPRTRILFTSRSPLPPPFAEHHLRIGRLSRSEAVELVSHVLKRDGVRPRAEHEEETDIDKLVDAVNCHARSLVLLSEELKRSGVSATTADLTELMHRLHARYPNDREKSLFASLELSLRRLSPEVRRLVPKLAVFHGGGHGWAIAQVLGLDYSKDEERPIIAELIAVGLAEPLAYNHVRLEPALGPYLRGELTAPDLQAAESAWLDAMAQLTGYLYQQLATDTQQAATLTLLELPNLLAALERLAREPHGASRGSVAAETPTREPPAASAVPLTPLEAVIDMAARLEGLLQYLGRPQALARAAAIRSQAAAELAKHQGADGWSHSQYLDLGTAIDRLVGSGRFAESVVAARHLVKRCEGAGERAYAEAAYDIATANIRLGRALKMSGAAAEALVPLSEARGRFERLGQAGNASAARMASVSLTDYADCLCNLGRLDEAAEAYEEAIELDTERGDLRDIAANKGQLGTVRLLQRRYPEALAAWDEARRTFEQLGEPGSVATAWHQIGRVHQEASQYDRAEYAYQQSLHIEVSRGNRAGEATTLNQLGNIYSRQGRREEAVRFYRQAADIRSAPDIQDLAGEGRARNNAADQLIQLGRHAEARQEILRAIECKAPFGHAAEPWKTFHILSDLERAVGDLPASAAARSRAIDAYLAYRRDGGENHSTAGQLAKLVTSTLLTGRPNVGEAGSQLAQLVGHPGYSRSQPFITTLQAILTGSRDRSLAADPRLDYDAAAELLLLLERLAAR